jgi:soluble lytic murein transglycosylase-like protein
MKRIIVAMTCLVLLLNVATIFVNAYEERVEFRKQIMEEEQRRVKEENEKKFKEEEVKRKVEKIMAKYNCFDEEIKAIILEQKEIMDPVVVAIVIGIESGYNRHATNPRSRCRGLMQIHDVHKLNRPYDIRQNINFGSRFLRELQQQFGSVDLMLAGYNAGPGRVKRCGGVPNFTETKNYIKKFKKLYEEV